MITKKLYCFLPQRQPFLRDYHWLEKEIKKAIYGLGLANMRVDSGMITSYSILYLILNSIINKATVCHKWISF